MPAVEIKPALLGAEKIVTTKLEDHPLAAIFPILEGDAFIALLEDINVNRPQEPIVLYEGKILDGRNRYRACTLEKVTVKARDYQGNDPIGFVLSANLHRRHLNENQRAIVGANLAKYELGANQHSKGEGLPVGIAAELLNVGARSIARAKKVLPFPELVEQVKKGQMSLTEAEKQAENKEAGKGKGKGKGKRKGKQREASDKVKIEYKEATDAKTALKVCNLLIGHLLDALEDLSQLSSLGHAETFAEQIKDAIDAKIVALQGEEETEEEEEEEEKEQEAA